ncbi:hypothetical protein [Streptomyces sp. 4N124]
MNLRILPADILGPTVEGTILNDFAESIGLQEHGKSTRKGTRKDPS